MIRHHYPTLFDTESGLARRATELAQRTYELVTFLTEVRGVRAVDARFPCRAAYHDACSGLRELGIERQPRVLLGSVGGLELVDFDGAETCCGFGGTFCVKYPAISNRMAADRAAAIAATDAEFVLSGDLGCLMNIAARLTRDGSDVGARHIAEVLAGMTEDRPVGEG
jgi:L-lactate dehydrogenase complex protein LldE